ncbi:MAG: hypothetical protein LBE38_09665 [Deltaproteobacteria bacterium]|nr:hypothetical protein [Deltaproteobacteria bacterium]
MSIKVPISSQTTPMSLRYQKILKHVPVPLAFLIVWSLSIYIAIFPHFSVFFAFFLLASGLILSGLSAKKRHLLIAAMIFFLFWFSLQRILSLLGQATMFYPAALFSYLLLGLHLYLVFSPILLSRAFARLAQPIVGKKRASYLMMAFMVLFSAIPWILEDALQLKKTLRRVSHLPLKERLSLWARSLVRLTLARSEALSRVLAKRQEDLF